MSKSICSTGLRWLWLVVAVLIIDLGSKYLILQNFALGETVPLFPSLNLHYARNYGAAFSFLLPTAAAGSAGSFRDRDRYLRMLTVMMYPFEGDAEAEQYCLRADYRRRAGQLVRSPVAWLCGRYDRLLRRRLAFCHLQPRR